MLKTGGDRIGAHGDRHQGGKAEGQALHAAGRPGALAAYCPRRREVLAVAVLGMGLYPQAFIEVVHQAANDLIAHVAQSKI